MELTVRFPELMVVLDSEQNRDFLPNMLFTPMAEESSWLSSSFAEGNLSTTEKSTYGHMKGTDISFPSTREDLHSLLHGVPFYPLH